MITNTDKELHIEKASLMDKSLAILLVEDNIGDVVLIKELLRSTGIEFSLKHVSTLKDTLPLCVEQKFDIILLDLGLPDSIGLETLKKIKVFSVASPVVVMTGLDDEDTALESLREGAQDYLVKNRLTPDNILRGIKYGIERKKIQDLHRRNARQFSLLSSATAAINECEDIPEIYNIACRNTGMLLEGAAIAAIELGNPDKFHFSGIEAVEPWYERIKQSTGLNLQDPVLNKTDRKREIIELFGEGKLHNLDHQDHVSLRYAERLNGSADSENYPDINIYAIGFIRNKTTYGGMLIFSREFIGGEDISIIETISNQISLSLQRKVIEKDLKASEQRYRKLNRDLEKKVKERTRELETLNSQLKQELKERHLAEEALKKSEASLRELNATKDKFFNIIAHDLKNPFTCLLGSTELLNESMHKMDPGKIRELVQIINDSAKSGYGILQNLLDWSRSQTGLITFNPEKVNLRDLIDENISDLKASSAKKEIRISTDIPGDMYFHADRNMINTVLRNLLSNAIKFTGRSGSVNISADLKDKVVLISVKDTGIGIPEDKISDLFRLDVKYTRPGTEMEEGTGLGLKLSREFVELQGGKIWVESIVNKGSNFIFSIPLKQNG